MTLLRRLWRLLTFAATNPVDDAQERRQRIWAEAERRARDRAEHDSRDESKRSKGR